MGGQDQGGGVGVGLDEGLAGLAGVDGIVAEAAAPLRLGDLDGAVHEVAGEDRFAGGRGQADGDVAGGVAGRGLEAQTGRDLVPGVDERGAAGLDDRRHAVGDAAGGLAALGGFPRPELPLLAGNDVARLRERRHPASALEPRVPADVVHVQVRAHDGVDLLGPDTDRRQIVEPRPLALIPQRRLVARLAVADAGIDEDRAPRHPHHPRLDARAEIAGALVVEVRPQPRVMAGDRLRRGVWQHAGGRIGRAWDLDDARDRDVAEGERNHANGIMRTAG